MYVFSYDGWRELNLIWKPVGRFSWNDGANLPIAQLGRVAACLATMLVAVEKCNTYPIRIVELNVLATLLAFRVQSLIDELLITLTDQVRLCLPYGWTMETVTNFTSSPLYELYWHNRLSIYLVCCKGNPLGPNTNERSMLDENTMWSLSNDLWFVRKPMLHWTLVERTIGNYREWQVAWKLLAIFSQSGSSNGFLILLWLYKLVRSVRIWKKGNWSTVTL